MTGLRPAGGFPADRRAPETANRQPATLCRHARSPGFPFPFRPPAMLVSASYRTDIPQYYTPWLVRRLEEGFVLVRNPLWPGRLTRYLLDPSVVDVLCLCSKDYRPLLPHLPGIAKRFALSCHYTVTAYGRDMEPGVPGMEERLRTLVELARIVGPQRVAWRFDPLLVTPYYTVERLLSAFAYLAPRIAPWVGRCIFSFVTIYRKVARNMPLLRPVTEEQRDTLARGMGEIAQRCGLPLQACATGEDFSRYGIRRSACLTLETLGAANGLRFRKLAHAGMRPGCRCMKSRDIGAYGCCPNACRYCYANADAGAARRRYRLHDPASPLLFGAVRPGDTVSQADQKSFLAAAPAKGKPRQGVLPGLEALLEGRGQAPGTGA